ncbi:MAG: metal dependent phosphohydrolase [Bacilli bacterium]|nr:metal dependent phosphohydrolase [Bacilli bacterium]
MYQSVIKYLFEQLDIPELLLKHSIRVAIYAKLLGEAMQLCPDFIDSLYYGSLIHDIGKLHISPKILLKRGKLTFEEYEEIKRHPLIGYEMIEPIPQLKELLPIVRSHHERIDGSGYPDRLSAEQIPQVIRIISIMDAFDAMTSGRSYGTRKSIENAIQELILCKDTQFDSQLVDLFIAEIIPGLELDCIFKQVELIAQSFTIERRIVKLESFKAVLFQLDQQEYAISIDQVISIERLQTITEIPKMPSHVSGVINLRGVVTPVVDIRMALLGKEAVNSETTRIIVVNADGSAIGLVVDSATDVLDIPADSLQQPKLSKENEASFLQGIAKINERLLIMIDIQCLLEDVTALEQLKEFMEAM